LASVWKKWFICCCFNKEKLHTNGFCLFCFLGFARIIFYPALFTLLYFIILVVAISFWWGTTKIKIKMNNSI
jgi:hypothetical protein